jgi:hypothetical protein
LILPLTRHDLLRDITSKVCQKSVDPLLIVACIFDMQLSVLLKVVVRECESNRCKPCKTSQCSHLRYAKGVEGRACHTSSFTGSSSVLILLKICNSASFRYSGGSGVAAAVCEYDRVHIAENCVCCTGEDFRADGCARSGLTEADNGRTVGRMCGRTDAEVMRRRRALEGAMFK